MTLLIFDCDGVLVDSELLEHGVDAELLAPYGVNASAAALMERFVGVARRDMYEIVFAELRQPLPAGLLDERERLVRQRLSLVEAGAKVIAMTADALPPAVHDLAC
jgi:beta-phosphoglucomutase-like phosphatase (HAD superfamily)